MPTTIIGMYALGTGGVEDAQANIDVPQDGVITGVDWSVDADQDADGETYAAELSFIATNQLLNNDVRGRISAVTGRTTLTTSGSVLASSQKFVGPMDLPVAAGERLYIHLSSSAGVATRVLCNLHLETGSTTRRSARR